MKYRNILVVVLTLLLFSACTTKPRFTIDDARVRARDGVETARTSDDYIVDANGKEFFREKIEPHFGVFRWIRSSKAPVYADDSKFAEPITYVYAREFVEIVDGRMGLDLTRIRIYNAERGYVEGFTKNNFFFSVDYYSEPYQLTEMEILRRREIDQQQQKREEERRRRNLEMQKQKEYNLALASARTDNRPVIRMNYQQLSSYLSPAGFTEDLVYTRNATRTLKFNKGNTALYVAMQDGQVTGLHVVNNAEAFSNEEANVLLFEFIGEIFYSVEDVENITRHIIRKTGVMERTEYPIGLKFDNTKENPITEITVGVFTGIE